MSRLLLGAGAGVDEALFAASYLGQVATRTQIPNTRNTTNKQSMTRRWHYARDEIVSLQYVILGYFIQASTDGTEAVLGGTATVTASVEYPVGVFTQVKFSTSSSGTVTSGGMLVSDACTVSIPRGAIFYSRLYWTSATGIIYCGFPSGSIVDTARGDAMTFGVSGIVDQTMGGTVVSTADTVMAPPAAIIAQTRRPSVLLLGDSKVMGFGDTFDATGDIGELARTIGPKFAYGNFGISNDRAQWVAATHAKRALLFPYFSHVICQLGVVDIFAASRSAAQLETDLATIWALFPGKPIWHTTITPGSTGAWTLADGSDQTTKAQNSVRVTFNNWLRPGNASLNGVIELANVVELVVDGGKWKAPGYTADGTHETQAGYLAIQSAVAIDAALIRPY